MSMKLIELKRKADKRNVSTKAMVIYYLFMTNENSALLRILLGISRKEEREWTQQS